MISVITASLPSRSAMLAECVASVASQTLAPAEHLVLVDHARRGPAEVRWQLVLAAASEWIAVLDDDDVLYPRHLELLAAETPRADIVYSYCEVEGRDWTPNHHFDADLLRARNYIPITALIRRDLIVELGGWNDGAANGWEDWDLWLRALDAGATFASVPEITWRYRFHGGNRTNVGRNAA